MKIILLPFYVALVIFAQHPAKAEDLSIVGTGDGLVIMNALAQAFNETHSGIVVNVLRSVGSSGGIKSVGNNRHVLGRIARKIKDKEKGYELEYQPFAKFPVVFFVNNMVPVTNLSTGQIRQIYSGEITNWREVSNGAGKIRVVRREDGDSSLQNLRRTLPGFGDVSITTKSKTTTTTQENFDIVEETSGTISFGPYPDATLSSVKVLNIGGIAPTDPLYPSFTTLALIYKAKNKNSVALQFIDFLNTETAQNVIRRQGGTPLSNTD